MTNSKCKVMIVVGEASGDSHAVKLARSLQELQPDTKFEFFGSTGRLMRAAGIESIVEADQFAIVGVPEVAKAIPMFLRVFQKLKKAAIEKKPDVIVLVDFPEFNLKLAKTLKKHGFKIVYYVSPQIWAWRQYRAKTIRKHVDLLLTILPFEEQWYQDKGISNVKYVGNPLAGEVKQTLSKEEFCVKYDLDSSRPIVSLLPGSRKKEQDRILPILIESASLMDKKRPGIQFLIAIAPTRSSIEVTRILENLESAGKKLPKTLKTIEFDTYDAIAASDAAAVTSGTATLETSILGTPLAIVYKSSEINAKLLRPLISVKYIGLVNLIADDLVAREFLQDDLTPDSLSRELFSLMEPETNLKMRERLEKVKQMLGDGGASRKAAAAILDQIADRDRKSNENFSGPLSSVPDV